MVDLETLAWAVRDMRRRQCDCFAHRDASRYAAARLAEERVDRLVREALAGRDLFERAAAARACAGERMTNDE